MDGQWTVHGSREAYSNEWATVSLVDVQTPSKKRFEHHVISTPKHKGGTAVLAHDRSKGVLMIWRHRFITDTWTWELPGGGIDSDETAEAAAVRETLEETGWRPGKLTELTKYQPLNGLVATETFLFLADGAKWEGPSADPDEAADVAWLPPDQINELIRKGEVSDGGTLIALLWALQFGLLER